jgi:integrase
VQIEYSVGGRRKTVTLSGTPTVRAVRAAAELRRRLVAAVGIGASAASVERLLAEAVRRTQEQRAPGVGDATGRGRVSRAAPRTADASEDATVGEVLDEYLCVRWPSLSPNSRRDYVGYVRARFKPVDLSGLGLGLPDQCFVAGRHSGAQPPDAGFTQEQSELFAKQAWWPTSTVPCVRKHEDVPLGPDEVASARRARRIATWKRDGGQAAGRLSPRETKTIQVIRPLELPLQCLAQLRVTQLSDVVAATLVSHWRQSLHPKTVANYLAFLKPAMQRLVAMGRLAANPFAGIKVSDAELRRRRRTDDAVNGDEDYWSMNGENAKRVAGYERDDDEPDPLSDVEMLAVLEQLDAHMREHYTFAFMTGLRTGEQLALQLRDYDRGNQRIRVRRSLSRSFEKRPKSGSGRWVYLNALAQAALERQLVRCQSPSDYIWVNPWTGQPWRGPNKLTKRWKRALTAAGVRYRRPYHTRHTYATLMLLAGESPYFVAQQLGHSDLEMLETRYARWIEAGRSRKPGAAMAAVHASAFEMLSQLLGAGAALGGASGSEVSAASQRRAVCD